MATMNVRTQETLEAASVRLGSALLAVAAVVCAVVLLCLAVVAVQHLAPHPGGTPTPAPGPAVVQPL